jgi:hypothetical protein
MPKGHIAVILSTRAKLQSQCAVPAACSPYLLPLSELPLLKLVQLVCSVHPPLPVWALQTRTIGVTLMSLCVATCLRSEVHVCA